MEVDCTKSNSRVEIDAIKIIGARDTRGAESKPETEQVSEGILIPCSNPVPPSEPEYNPNKIEEWVSRVVNFSSQYDSVR